MLLDYLASLTSIFGDSAELTGTGANAVLSFKPAQTGSDTGFNAPEDAKPEGLLLALLQKANDAQGITPNRALEISKSAFIANKDGQQVTGEQYVVRVFSASSLPSLDPAGL
jgi:hypothetical protein